MSNKRTAIALGAVGIWAAITPVSTVEGIEPQVTAVPVDGQAPGGPAPVDRAFLSDACPATDVGTLAADGSVTIPGETCSSVNDYENDGADCTYGSGGPDEIFQFTVDRRGVWQLDTMTICAGWDTSLMVREEIGGGCPGDWRACDGDGGHASCGSYESALEAFLVTETTYYLVVDGWSTFTCGSFEVVAFLVEAACVNDSDCDDGMFCNGAETCDTAAGGECLPGTPPCVYYQICDEDNDVCIDPDPCVSWLGGGAGGYFYPIYKIGVNAWCLDDIELQGHTGQELEYYELHLIGRGGIFDVPIGTEYFIDTSLFTVEEGSCLPETIIPGTECTLGPFYVQPGGSPPDVPRCEPDAPVTLPDNSGDFSRCEIDFFFGFRGECVGVGFLIAGENQRIGGPAADDDFGISVVYFEEAPLSGTFDVTWFGDDEHTPADFADAVVCTVPIWACCVADDPWDCYDDITEQDCTALGGVWKTNNIWGSGGCEDPDGDGLPGICGDNCPDVPNPAQEDCDAGATFAGDACETEPGFADDDGDGECNGTDGCPNDANKIAPGLCGCGVPDEDSDGDGVPDCTDGCPHDPTKIDPGQCGCGLPEDDTDDDGVADCIDQCPEVDDAIFAPGCAGAIPTVSQWGLIALALLLLVAAKVYFGRGRRKEAKA